MAKVEQVVGDKVITVKAITGFTLTLTPLEAIALHSLLGGVCDDTNHHHTLDIYSKLNDTIPGQFKVSGAYDWVKTKGASRIMQAAELFEKQNRIL